MGDTIAIFGQGFVVNRIERLHPLSVRPSFAPLETPSLLQPEIVKMGGGSFKSQFKRADKSGASWALVYGETEVTNHQVTLKPLRSEAAQRTIGDAELTAFLADFLAETQRA